MNPKKKILFIINPISGIGKKNTIPSLIQDKLNHAMYDYEISYTKHRGHGYQIAKENHMKYDAIVAVGGDGSVNEIGSALVETKCALAIIPCGSGNGLARHARIPLKAEKAIDRINAFQSQTIDVGRVNDKLFLATCGFGFDGLIAQKFDEHHSRGFGSYVRLVLRELKKYQPVEYEIHYQDSRWIEKLFLCVVANATEFGNGFKISPMSDFSDGKMELIRMKPAKMIQFPAIASRFFKGTILQSKLVSSLTWTDQMTIRTTDASEIYLQIDGEPAGHFSEFKIDILPKSLILI